MVVVCGASDAIVHELNNRDWRPTPALYELNNRGRGGGLNNRGCVLVLMHGGFSTAPTTSFVQGGFTLAPTTFLVQGGFDNGAGVTGEGRGVSSAAARGLPEGSELDLLLVLLFRRFRRVFLWGLFCRSFCGFCFLLKSSSSCFGFCFLFKLLDGWGSDGARTTRAPSAPFSFGGDGSGTETTRAPAVPFLFPSSWGWGFTCCPRQRKCSVSLCIIIMFIIK